MIKATLKFIVFCVTILLIGQIRVSGETVGAHVQKNITTAGIWVGDWVASTQWGKSIGAASITSKWTMEAGAVKVPRPKPSTSLPAPKRKVQERITSEEQREIRRLLE